MSLQEVQKNNLSISRRGAACAPMIPSANPVSSSAARLSLVFTSFFTVKRDLRLRIGVY